MEYRHIERFAPRAKLAREVDEGVVGRWGELGFDGQAPKVDGFEDREFTPRAPCPGIPVSAPINRH